MRRTESGTGDAPARHRSKVIVALLAVVFGGVGAHWWYLGRAYAWLLTAISCLLMALAWFYYPVWWDNAAFFLLIIPATAGFIEALIFSLKTDDWFDARYNPQSGRTTRTGWAPVLIAIFTTIVGSSALLFMIALTVIHVYKALGWLDDYVL